MVPFELLLLWWLHVHPREHILLDLHPTPRTYLNKMLKLICKCVYHYLTNFFSQMPTAWSSNDAIKSFYTYFWYNQSGRHIFFKFYIPSYVYLCLIFVPLTVLQLSLNIKKYGQNLKIYFAISYFTFFDLVWICRLNAGRLSFLCMPNFLMIWKNLPLSAL